MCVVFLLLLFTARTEKASSKIVMYSLVEYLHAIPHNVTYSDQSNHRLTVAVFAAAAAVWWHAQR